MKTTPIPHDAVFKQFLTHPETAHDFLQLHLPPAVLTHCDLSTLKLESGSFVEEDLRAYYYDVLYSLKAGIAAMQRHLDALVVPLLFYHGQVTPYPYSMRWLDEFGDPELATQLYTRDSFPWSM